MHVRVELWFWAISLVAVGGCAAPRTFEYNHASSTQQQFMQDRYACVQQAQQSRSSGYANAYGASLGSAVVTNRGVFMSCMGAKGYTAAEKGQFTVPAGSEVIMVD